MVERVCMLTRRVGQLKVRFNEAKTAVGTNNYHRDVELIHVTQFRNPIGSVIYTVGSCIF